MSLIVLKLCFLQANFEPRSIKSMSVIPAGKAFLAAGHQIFRANFKTVDKQATANGSQDITAKIQNSSQGRPASSPSPDSVLCPAWFTGKIRP